MSNKKIEELEFKLQVYDEVYSSSDEGPSKEELADELARLKNLLDDEKA